MIERLKLQVLTKGTADFVEMIIVNFFTKRIISKQIQKQERGEEKSDREESRMTGFLYETITTTRY